MILLLDCETSGLLKYGLPNDDPQQPWIVSLAAELVRADDLSSVAFLHFPIRADGRTIEPEAEAVHGYSRRDLSRSGMAETVALDALSSLAGDARMIVGHGVAFDQQVCESVMRRAGRDPRLLIRPGLQIRCTMKAAVPVCKIPTDRKDGGYKWPSLDEACTMLLGEEPRSGRHSAWDDIQRTKRLYAALRERRVFEE